MVFCLLQEKTSYVSVYIYIERKMIVAYDDGHFSISIRADDNTRKTVNRSQSIVRLYGRSGAGEAANKKISSSRGWE